MQEEEEEERLADVQQRFAVPDEMRAAIAREQEKEAAAAAAAEAAADALQSGCGAAVSLFSDGLEWSKMSHSRRPRLQSSAYMPPISPLHLPISPLHLPYISPQAAPPVLRRRRRRVDPDRLRVCRVQPRQRAHRPALRSRLALRHGAGQP